MMVKFNKGQSIYWSEKLKMDYLQRQIIVHSILYYILNESVISDKKYDSLCKQLMELKLKYPEKYKRTEYYYCMYDFDGNTGFDIYSRLTNNDKTYLKHIALEVLNLYKT